MFKSVTNTHVFQNARNAASESLGSPRDLSVRRRFVRLLVE